MVGTGHDARCGENLAGGDIGVLQAVLHFDFSLLHHGVFPSCRRQNCLFLLSLIFVRTDGDLLAGATQIPQYVHLLLEILDLLVNIIRLIRNSVFVDGFFLDIFTAQFLRFLDGFGRILGLSFQYFFIFLQSFRKTLFRSRRISGYQDFLFSIVLRPANTLPVPAL